MFQRSLRRIVPTMVRPVTRRTASTSSEAKKVGFDTIFEADSSALMLKVFHWTQKGLLVAAPLAFILSPSPLNLPLDLYLGVAFPVHAHVGMNGVITDYVPKPFRAVARYGLLGSTGLALLGLLKLNLMGPGITEAYKSLWRAKSEDK